MSALGAAARSASGGSGYAALRAGEQAKTGVGPGFTPIRVLLDATSAPAYTIGNLVAGRPGEAAKTFLSAGQWGKKTLLSDALRERGALPGGWAGTALGLGLDIATDPTTYVTFGAGGAAKAAAKQGASQVLTRAAREAAKKGERVALTDVAKASAMGERAAAGVDRSLTVGFRVPFTRGKVVPLAESKKAARAGAKVADAIGSTRIGENLREVFLPAGSGSKVAHRVGSDVRRYGDTEKRVVSQQAVRYQREVAKAAKASKLSEADAHKALVRSLDQPEKYPVPEGLSHLRDDASRILDDLRRMEDTAGIDRGLVPDYVPHLPANANERRKMERLFPLDPDRPFFFQKSRELPNLDAWEAMGLKPEYNLSRLLEVRGHASVDARVLKAFDDVVADLPVSSVDVARVKEAMRPAISGHFAIEDTKRFVNSVGSSWKALALLSPGYHARNMQSDLVSAYWAGARNPLSFIQAAKALTGRGKPIRIGDETFSADELIALAESSGAIRLGQSGKEIRGELAEAGGARLARSGLRPSRPGHGKLSRGSQAVGNAREDMVRLGTFIERMKAGDDAMQAAKVTRDFLFDYGDVGKFVQAARKFWMPFITFPSKAIPMVGRQVITRPGTLATTNKVTQALNEAAGDPDLSLLPMGARSSFAVPAPGWVRKAIGAPDDQALLFNPESVLAYGSANLADPTNPLRGAGGLLNPIPKAAIEGKTGYSFYFNGPGGKTVKSPAIINLLAKHGIPIPGAGQKTSQYTGETSDVYSRNLDLALRIFPPFSQSASLIPGGGSDTTRLPYLKYFGGLTISPYDQSKAAFYAEKYGRK